MADMLSAECSRFFYVRCNTQNENITHTARVPFSVSAACGMTTAYAHRSRTSGPRIKKLRFRTCVMA